MGLFLLDQVTITQDQQLLVGSIVIVLFLLMIEFVKTKQSKKIFVPFIFMMVLVFAFVIINKILTA